MTLKLTTTAFASGGKIPTTFTCDGADVSPALGWSAPPPGTQSFALILDDPDAPGRVWVHWLLYDLPATERELPEGLPKEGNLPSGARQGRNDFGRIGYGGPCPPPGSAHRYFFRLFALDKKVTLPGGATRKQLERSMSGHILAQTELMGRYSRR
jgi:Raf kinase inhibitor-like YbhB/YbcL family protein